MHHSPRGYIAGGERLPPPRATTTARGYGYQHKRIRAALMSSAYGRTCHLCGQPMWRGQDLDLDHTRDRHGYHGMTHASCNRRDGAQRSHQRNQKRGISRAW